MRSILLLLTVALLTSLLLINCRRNDLNLSPSFVKAKQSDLTDVKKPMNMSLARLYYKMLTREYGNKVDNMQGDNRINRKYAYWKKAYVTETKRYTFDELPLLYNRRRKIVK